MSGRMDGGRRRDGAFPPMAAGCRFAVARHEEGGGEERGGEVAQRTADTSSNVASSNGNRRGLFLGEKWLQKGRTVGSVGSQQPKRNAKAVIHRHTAAIHTDTQTLGRGISGGSSPPLPHSHTPAHFPCGPLGQPHVPAHTLLQQHLFLF